MNGKLGGEVLRLFSSKNKIPKNGVLGSTPFPKHPECVPVYRP